MRPIHWIVLVFAITAMLLLSQEDGPSATVPIQMIVTAEARHGKEIPELKSGDVMVFQKKERLRVTSLVPSQREHAALELYILIDDASGISLGSQLNDIRQFIQAQPAATSIGIGYMRNGTVQMTQDLTPDHAKAAKSGVRLPLGFPGASPSPFLSLSDLIQRWPPSPARHEVLMIGSGIDALGGEAQDPYLDEAIDHAQRAGIVVYAIYAPASGHEGHSYWRMNWGQNHLAQIAEETGGESYMLGFGPLVSFAPYLTELSEHLAHQYVMTFLAKPGKKAGFQSIRLTTEVPNAELVAAGKFYVPAGH